MVSAEGGGANRKGYRRRYFKFGIYVGTITVEE